MEQLKTAAEKRTEIQELRLQRERQYELLEKQRRHQERQRALQEIEKFKPYVIQLINSCSEMPLSLSFSEMSDVELLTYLDVNGTKGINFWLNENGYKIVAFESHDCSSKRDYEIIML
jgi:hypothetical protein